MKLSNTLSLQVPYSHQVLPVIVNFARESSVCFGADQQEAQAFELAVEEAAVTIIEGLPAGYSGDDYFMIMCEVEGEGISFRLKNLGLPVDTQRLPKYSTDNPDESSEGLSLHLMTSLMDKVEFENQGHNGWQTYLFKTIKKIKKTISKQTIENDSENQTPITDYEVKIAPAEMAYEVSKLTYFNYGYSYSKDNFYYPEKVTNMIEEEKVVSIVAVSSENQIIGHLGLRKEDSQPKIAEVMLAMVHPDYRGSRCFYKMSKTMFEYCVSSSLECLYSGLVTKHVYSQKSAIMFGMKPTAFRLSLHPRANYKSMDSSEDQRETLLDAYTFLNKKRSPIKVSFPVQHRAIIEKTLESLSFAWQEQSSTALEKIASDLEILEQGSIGLATITAKALGEDFIKRLAILTKDLSRKKIETIYLWIDLETSALDMLDQKLESLGFFYSGLRPKDVDSWHITYTYFNNQKFDYSGVRVADPFATELLNHIEACDLKAQQKQLELLI